MSASADPTRVSVESTRASVETNPVQTSLLVAASTAGASAARRVLTCSASSTDGQTRASYLKAIGLATAATVATVAAPSIALAEGTPADGEPEVKIGEEVTTDSGLKYVVTVAGKGTKPTAGNTIKAHYTGQCLFGLMVAFLWQFAVWRVILRCNSTLNYYYNDHTIQRAAGVCSLSS